MNKVKGFNYNTEKHKHIIEHIEKQLNQSQYIWSLVEKDMNSENIEDKIERIVRRLLKDMDVHITEKEKTIDISSIKDILGM